MEAGEHCLDVYSQGRFITPEGGVVGVFGAIKPEPEQPAIDLPEETELSMEDIFNSVSNGLMKMDFDDDDDVKLDTGYGTPAKKKKKKKGVEIEYDPDSDSTTVRRKHKRGDDDWGW